MTKKWLTATGVVVAIVIFFGINIVGGRTLDTARLDLTENNLFTLNQGTDNILKGLDEPITLRLYLSQKIVTRIPQLNNYAKRVKSLLREYARHSNGAVTVRFLDPEPFSEEEERAVGYGLQGIPMQDTGDNLYFGLVGSNSTDEQEVIPFFSEERSEMLEYDLSQFVYRLSSAEQPTIGLISQLPVEGSPGAQMPGMPAMGPSGPWVVVEQMREIFDVQNLGVEITEIPEAISVLLLVHPKVLSDNTLYAIDQFVLNGGRLIAFVDPHAESDVPQQGMQVMGMSRASTLDKLTEGWGVKLTDKSFAGDISRAVKVRATPQFGSAVLDYPLWINLSDAEFNQDDPVTSKLGSLMFGSPGYFTVESKDGLTVTPLVSTTENAMIIGDDKVGPGIDPRDLLRGYQPGGEVLDIAIRVRGPAKTAFPNGPDGADDNKENEGEPADEDTAQAQGEEAKADEDKIEGDDAKDEANEESVAEKTELPESHLVDSSEDINVILVADTDLLQDQFWVQIQDVLGSRIAVPTAANGSFVINALDNMSGSSDLIGIRNRPSFSRPLDLFEKYRQDAEMSFRQKENELTEQLRSTEDKLRELNEGSQMSDQGLMFSPEQEQEIQNFQSERLRIRRELREVQRQLNKDIESAQTVAKAVNIGGVPIAVSIFGLLVGWFRTRKRGQRESAS